MFYPDQDSKKRLKNPIVEQRQREERLQGLLDDPNHQRMVAQSALHADDLWDYVIPEQNKKPKTR